MASHLPSAPRAGAQADGTLLVLVMTLVLLVPSFAISIPGAPDILRTTDLVGAASIGLYVLYRMRSGRISKAEGLLALFMFLSTIVSVLGFLLVQFDPDYRPAENANPLLYQLRMIFIMSPALMILALNLDVKTFSKFGFAYSLLGVLLVLFMCAMYIGGSSAFNAHQTLSEGGMNRFHRLGGLTGETGSFAYYAVIIYILAVFFCFMRGFRRLGFLMMAAMPVYFAELYFLVQARAIVLTFVIALICMFPSRVFFGKIFGVLMLVAAVLAVFVVMAFRVHVSLNDRLLLRFQFLTGGGGEIRSGREGGWRQAFDSIVNNPLIGEGYRAMEVRTGYSVENFFLSGMVDYGLFVFVILLLFYYRIGRPIFAIPLQTLQEQRGVDMARACVVLRGLILMSLAQWQFNDLNSFFQSFPMVLITVIGFSKIIDNQTHNLTRMPPTADGDLELRSPRDRDGGVFSAP